MTHRRIAFLIVALALLGAGTVRAASVEVDARAAPYVFAPANRTVAVGDTVVWTMLGEPHTVTSGTIDGNNVGHPDGRFDSGTRLVGEQYSLTFSEPGTFPYFCIIHADSQMKGTITVAAAATPPPTAAPTPAPTRRPTAAPTAAPTPTATPTPSPTASPAPTASPTPTPSPTPSPTPIPTPTASSTASLSAAPSPPGDPTAPASADVPPLVLGGLVAVVVLGATGAAYVARRRGGA